jgi:hypothetical protein
MGHNNAVIVDSNVNLREGIEIQFMRAFGYE